MPLRKPEPLPIPFDFIRFLTSSITFMAHLSEVSVYFDGFRLARLRKDRGVPRSVGLRKGLKAESARGMMRITDVSMMRTRSITLFNQSRGSTCPHSPEYQS